MASVEGMASGGEYAANSLSQQASFRLLHDDARREIDQAFSSSQKRVTVADFGSADGLAARQLLEESMSEEVKTSIDFVLQDLPGNDWNAAARLLHPLADLQRYDQTALQAAARGTGLRVFSMSGTFHNQLFPNESIDIALSGTAFHWLSDTSRLPRLRSICISNPGIDKSTKAAWANHAADDWANIVTSRAAELKPGGAFLFVHPSVRTYAALFQVLDSILIDCERAGILTSEAREQLALPAYPRTADELMEGISKEPRLEVIHVDEHDVRSPYYPAPDLSHEDTRNDFAHRYAASVFGWCGPMLQKVFKDKHQHVNAFRDAMEREIGRRMLEFEYDYHNVTVLARKKS